MKKEKSVPMHEKMFTRVMREKLARLTPERLLGVYAFWESYEKNHLHTRRPNRSDPRR